MYPYQNKQLKIRDRVEDLLARMSIKEKVGQVNQHLYGWECYENTEEFCLTETFKEHVEWGGGIGALYGLFRADPWSKVDFSTGVSAKDSWKVVNEIQKYVVSNSRWGIPALIVEECPHGHMGLEGISYPVNLGKGNSFNTDLIRKSSQMMAKELSLKGVHIALVSTMDLLKDPRWGRSEECFGEDPILSAKMTEAVVEGFQGNLIEDHTDFLNKTILEVNKEDQQIGVVLKHCIAQGDALGGHNSGTVTIGQREFSDVYDPLLKSARNSVGVMAAYNDIDGVPCHTNKYLLTDQLRGRHHFQGIVMADGVALDRLQDVYNNKLVAGAKAIDAGVDLSLWDDTYLHLSDSIENGFLTEEILDKAVYRVLSIKFLLGLFDQPYVTDPKESLETIIEESDKLNLEVAKESLTLLKNNGVLPLKEIHQKIAVVGPNGNDIYNMLGDYTAPQQSKYTKSTVYEAIKREFSSSDVTYSKGCEVRNTESQNRYLDEAIENSKKADIIILVLGGSSARNFDMTFLRNGAVSSKGINMDSGENVDVASLELGGMQLKLFDRIKQLNKPIVTLLIQGRPYDIQEISEHSDAILVSWFPGQQGGKAIAETLSGKNNPSGKLSISYPRTSSQLPIYYYQRDASKQDDYYDLEGAPIYDFGYGLSYGKFEYDQMEIKQTLDTILISVKVKNIGTYSSKESILLFVKLYGGNVIHRVKQLKDFKKEFFEINEEKTITFELDKNHFEFMDSDYNIKVAEKINVQIETLEATVHIEN